TIGDITRKNSAPIPIIKNANTNAEQESEHAEAVLPPLHRPARRGRYPRLAVRSECQPPRPARYRFDVRARTGGRLQHQERYRGLCDPGCRSLNKFRLTDQALTDRPLTSQEPPTTR